MDLGQRKRAADDDSEDSDRPLRDVLEKRRRLTTPIIPPSPGSAESTQMAESPSIRRFNIRLAEARVNHRGHGQSSTWRMRGVPNTTSEHTAAGILQSIPDANRAQAEAQGTGDSNMPCPSSHQWRYSFPTLLPKDLLNYMERARCMVNWICGGHKLTAHMFWALLHHPDSASSIKPVWSAPGLARQTYIGFVCAFPDQHRSHQMCQSSPNCHHLVVNSVMLFRPSLVIQTTYLAITRDGTKRSLAPLHNDRWRVQDALYLRRLDHDLHMDFREYLLRYTWQLAAWLVKDVFYNGTQMLDDEGLSNVFRRAVVF
ncbi:hypothetical protein F66182_1954 [Fusarium sp. NRRL 66182]|nr:hypothetical protein F66182_1954 [Fusarium sp. NRRL 66182]